MNIIGSSGAGAMVSVAMGLLAEARKAEANLPEEERKRRREESRNTSEERMRRALIIQNNCPFCGGKLVRGKKDKRNDYKRAWKCSACNEIHSI